MLFGVVVVVDVVFSLHHDWRIDLLAPGLQVVEPLLGRVVTELLVSRGVGYLVAEVGALGLDHEGVVVVVGGLLAGYVLLRNVDGKANSLAAPFYGVGRGVVGAPAGAEALVVAELLRVLYVDDACRESQVAHVAAEVYVDVGVAVAGILGVADGHVK